jgi:chromate reductase
MTLCVLGIPGSLRHGSINRELLGRLDERTPAGARFDIFDGLGDVPLFSEDLESPSAPSGVERLWRAAKGADVLLFATPEYNQSLPGVVKNAVDWLSRDPDRALRGKACAVTGATVGRWGTRIAQQQLRTVLATCGARLLASPVLYIAEGATADASEQELDAYWGAILAESGGIRLAA